MMRVRDVLLNAIVLEGITQATLAQRTGLSQKHISWLVNSHAYPSVRVAVKLEAALQHISAETLLTVSNREQLSDYYENGIEP